MDKLSPRKKSLRQKEGPKKMSATVSPPAAPTRTAARAKPAAAKNGMQTVVTVPEPVREVPRPTRAPRAGTTLTISQAADALGIDQRTLRQWADSGYAPHILLPSGYRRFTPEQIERVREKINVPEGRARESSNGSA